MKFLILGLIVICFTVFFMPQANAQSHDGYSWDDYACIDSMLEFDKQALLSLQQQLEESTNSEEQVNLINAAATIIQKYCPSIDFDIPKKVILKNGTYENKLYDFSIEPPKTWNISENVEAVLFAYQVAFTPPGYFSQDEMLPQLVVNFENVGELENPFISNEELLKNYNTMLLVSDPSAKIISQDIDKKSWGWLIMREVVFTNTYYMDISPYSATVLVHTLQYVIHFKDGETYTLGYLAGEGDFDEYYSEVIESMESFEVRDTKPFYTESSITGGGCLIATATYGSELAPEVQKLRELRDNSLLSTESGTNFMNSFNEMYYSFSPTIADYERENPLFKEMVKLFITPMITSLSILNYVEMNSESEVLGYGISLIVLNGLMYVGIPVLAVMRFRK